MKRTLAIIKPDAVGARNAGAIVTMVEQAGFTIRAMRMSRLTTAQAEGFYAVHKDKPFFPALVKFMTEGPIIVMALEREDAILKWREVMGATNPEKAGPGTIRKKFGTNIERNAVHGSDAPETAATELAFFFRTVELI